METLFSKQELDIIRQGSMDQLLAFKQLLEKKQVEKEKEKV